MKFCTKCGHELLDDAVICAACGCMVAGDIQPNKNKAEQKADKTNKTDLLCVFNFIFSVASALCLFCFLISVCVYLNFEMLSATLVMILAAISLTFAILGFVKTLMNHLNKEKLFNSITRLVVAGLLVILTLFAVNMWF